MANRLGVELGEEEGAAAAAGGAAAAVVVAGQVAPVRSRDVHVGIAVRLVAASAVGVVVVRLGRVRVPVRARRAFLPVG